MRINIYGVSLYIYKYTVVAYHNSNFVDPRRSAVILKCGGEGRGFVSSPSLRSRRIFLHSYSSLQTDSNSFNSIPTES